MKPTVEHFMTRAPHTIGRDQPLARAHELMRKHNVRHLPVLHGGAITGIISQRDLYFIESLGGVDLESVTVDEAMTTEVYTVLPTTPLADVTARMMTYKLGSVVVVDAGKVVGVFTTHDALRALSSEVASDKPSLQP